MHCISTQGKNRTPQRKRLSFVYFTFLFLFFFFWGSRDLFLSWHQSNATHCHHLMQFNGSCFSWVPSIRKATTRLHVRKGKRADSSNECASRNIREGGREGGRRRASTHASNFYTSGSFISSFYTLTRTLWSRCYVTGENSQAHSGQLPWPIPNNKWIWNEGLAWHMRT